MNKQEFKIMGTGSRSMRTDPNNQQVFRVLCAFLEMMVDQLSRYNIVLVSGMAEGWDEAIAKAGRTLGIPYDVVIPTKDYGNYYWRRHSVMGIDRGGMYQLLVAQARNIIHLEDIYGDPVMTNRGPLYNGVHANFARNQVMVDMSQHALVYKPQSSGTRDCVGRLIAANVPYDTYPFDLQQTLF